MLSKLIAALQNAKLEMTAEEIADMLWLAFHMNPLPETSSTEPHIDLPEKIQTGDNQLSGKQHTQEIAQSRSLDIHASSQYGGNEKSISPLTGLPFRSPAASALPNTLALSRALRPFMRRLPSKTAFVFNENATVQIIAETPKNTWLPVLDAAPVRWFDVALVVDDGASMMLWRQTIVELRTLLDHHGAFRNVRVWKLATDDKNRVQLYTEIGSTKEQTLIHNPKELIDPSGRRLILVVTDCVSLAWHSGKVQQLFDLWGRKNLVTLIQMLPRRLWHQTVLGMAHTAQIKASSQEASNARLKIIKPFQWVDENTPSQASFPIPVVTLEPKSLLSWARIMTGSGNTWITGKIFVSNPDEALNNSPPGQEEHMLSANKRVQLFRANASLPARKLAGLLAATPVPISLHVIRLIQHTLLPEAGQVHIAEVFLGGLLEIFDRDQATYDLDYAEYDFIVGVRDELLNAVPISDGQRVLKEISEFIEHRYGQTRDFLALMTTQGISIQGLTITREIRPFAQIAATVLRRFGGDFALLAATLEQQINLLDIQSAEKPTILRKTNTILESSQTYMHSGPEESTLSNQSFLSKTWCDFHWTEWIPFDSATMKTLPTGAGIYRVRAVEGDELFYIGYTGRNLREHIGNLIYSTMRDPSQMPFSDPHTAAPALWAWKKATGVDFACSTLSLSPQDNLEVLVHYLLWQYRLEKGNSTRANHGRFHPEYTKSGNRSTGRRGYRLPEGSFNPAGGRGLEPLRLEGTPLDKTWMGLQWGKHYPLVSSDFKQIDASPGAYKVMNRDAEELLFVGSTPNLRNRLQDLKQKNWGCPHPMVAFALQSLDLSSSQLAELENDLLGGYYEQTKKAPKLQFGRPQLDIDTYADDDDHKSPIPSPQ